MVDLAVTASQVLPDTGFEIRRGIAAVAITAGQLVCFDPLTSTVKLYDANDAAVYSLQPGIAVCGASIGQSVAWQEAPGAQITMGAGAAPGVGAVFVGSANPGGIAAVADLAAGHMRSVVGVGIATSKIKLIAWNSAVLG